MKDLQLLILFTLLFSIITMFLSLKILMMNTELKLEMENLILIHFGGQYQEYNKTCLMIRK